MIRLRSWIVVLVRASRYLLYRLGWAKRPDLYSIRYEIMVVCEQLAGWRKRMRIVDGDKCPRTGPVIIAGNHFSSEDPFLAFAAVYYASHGALMLHPMMREGIFREGSWAKSKLLDLDEVADMTGVGLISRDRVQLSQLKPFFRYLDNDETVLIYPGRTRSRSGLFIEYPEGLDEPGAVSFFITYSQRKRPDRPVPAVPLVRTTNPVTGREAMVFGDPQFLPVGASREQQRDFDAALIVSLGQLVEVNTVHVLSGLIYLHCLHGIDAELTVSGLADDLQKVLARIDGCKVDPAVVEDPLGQTRRTLRWLTKRGVLSLDGDRVRPNREVILAAPEPDKQYKKLNPVKYFANQILHLSQVTQALDDVVAPRLPS